MPSATRCTQHSCLAGAVAVALVGCDRTSKQPAPAPHGGSAVLAAPQPHPTLDGWVGAWRAGHRAEALAALEHTPWDSPDATFSCAALRLSESEFVARPPTEQSQIKNEALDLVPIIRDIAKAALADSRVRSAAGDAAGAERLRASVQRLAERLSDPTRHLAQFNLVGDALRRLAASPQAPATGAAAGPG